MPFVSFDTVSASMVAFKSSDNKIDFKSEIWLINFANISFLSFREDPTLNPNKSTSPYSLVSPCLSFFPSKDKQTDEPSNAEAVFLMTSMNVPGALSDMSPPYGLKF